MRSSVGWISNLFYSFPTVLHLPTATLSTSTLLLMNCSVCVINWFLCLVGVFDSWGSFIFYVLGTLDIFYFVRFCLLFLMLSRQIFLLSFGVLMYLLLDNYCVVIYYVLCCWSLVLVDISLCSYFRWESFCFDVSFYIIYFVLLEL